MNYLRLFEWHGLDCWFDNDWLRRTGRAVEYLLAASLMAIPGGILFARC